jgi:hypothetical protein
MNILKLLLKLLWPVKVFAYRVRFEVLLLFGICLCCKRRSIVDCEMCALPNCEVCRAVCVAWLDEQNRAR